MNDQDIQPAKIQCFAIGSCRFLVPPRTARLLYLSEEDPSHVSFGPSIAISLDMLSGQPGVWQLPQGEPSTIYSRLPVNEPANTDEIPRPSYYPSYVGLSPEQRWIYLTWLRDIAAPINIGYVFIYYYGLERQLLTGEFDLSFEEILFLRQHHKHNSLLAYSNAALLHSCIYRKRKDRLQELYRNEELERLGNTGLLIAHHLGYDLSQESLINISSEVDGINRRYIKTQPELFAAILSEVLREKYGDAYLPFAGRYQIADLPSSQQILFANISFPQEIRTPLIPNFFDYGPFSDEVRKLFDETHQRVKVRLKEGRKRR